MPASFRAAFMAAALALAASGCASTYHARADGASDGYSDRQLAADRWRVEYVGEELSSEQQVETFLLLRAAQVTVANGYDWFAPSAHESETQEELVVEAMRRPSVVWRPLWRQRQRPFAWSDWRVRGAPPPSATPPQPYVAQRYAAREDILLGRGPTPPDAFDARHVIETVAPGAQGWRD
ncbi:MAG: hypothetical protein JNL81_05830 [Hyphomonadaceae bacterium]|nr:hypothetical protein [Hyphomonadaceae bacterium]